MSTTLDWAEQAARSFEPRASRWSTPGDLARDLEPNTVQTPALNLIDDALVDVEAGRTDRLIICMPPQEGKSTRVTTIGPLWFLTRNPDRRIAVVSYGQDLANQFGRAIRNHIVTNAGQDDTLDLGLRIAADNGSASSWQIDRHAGGVRSVGLTGGLTGRPADALFIDDPISNMEQAQSSTYRDRAWNFWQSVGSTRLAPGAPVVLVLTRWHEDDLAGKLLAAEDGHRWRVVSIPAIAERTDDPLGRDRGEAMVSARGDRDWAAIRTSVGEYVWSALYQQRPSPAAGGLFKRLAIRHWTPMPDNPLGRPAIMCRGRAVYLETLHRFLTVDLAASTKTSADYTAVGVWGITLDGDLVLLDGARARLDPSKHWATVRQLRDRWDAGTVYVEAAMNATTMVHEAGREGVPIEPLQPDKDKVTRAIPAAALADAGRLWFPSAAHAPWVTDWVDEHAAFPNGAHDDTVDTTGYAARIRAAHWLPMMSADQHRALEASSRELDLMTVPL